MTFNSELFRQAMGRFATGVTVVTGLDSDCVKRGLTVNAFSSVSLDPPLVLICLDNSTFGLAAFTEGTDFNVNILTAAQDWISDIFAGRGEDKFANVTLAESENGLPAIADSLAIIECKPEAVHPGGDHVVLIGRVANIALGEELNPLLYFRSRYGGLRSI